jgi:hypothetical protein
LRSNLFPACLLAALVVSCQTRPYAPPPRAALVESVEVEVGHFAGRPEAHAIVRGQLSSTAAQLVESRQSRVERQLVLEVREQTPRGANLLGDLGESRPFETRIPIEILGLDPGPILLHANGHVVEFEIPALQAEPVGTGEAASLPAGIALVDEFIPIEDTVSAGGNLRGVRIGGPARRPQPDAMTDP